MFKYERGKTAPSIDAARKTADSFVVSLDTLVDKGIYKGFDKKLQRFKDLEHLEEEKRKLSLI